MRSAGRDALFFHMGASRLAPIDESGADRSFPLAKTTDPALTLERWRDFFRATKFSRGDREPRAEAETIVLASNAEDYARWLCIYRIRNLADLGRVLDVAVFVVVSAADAEGVKADMLDFLAAERDESGCAGLRFWTMDSRTWERWRDPEYAGRADHGRFAPASGNATALEAALASHLI